jgi:hypothetical protein
LSTSPFPLRRSSRILVATFRHVVGTAARAPVVGAFVAALLLLFASTAAAQQTIVVIPGALWGIDEDGAGDLVEESAFIAEDHGGFSVTRYYELATTLRAETWEQLVGCAGVASCYADGLYRTGYNFVLVVTIEDTGTEVFVQYTLVDVRNERLVVEELATLSSRTDFGALQAPCISALDLVAPRDTRPPPVAEVLPIDGGADPYSGALFDADRWTPPARGPLGQAGVYTAIAGGVILAGGVLLGFSADDIQQDIQAAPRPRSELETLQQSGQTRAAMANAAFAVGGIAIATGATLLIVDRAKRRSENRPAGLQVEALPSWSGVSLRATF